VFSTYSSILNGRLGWMVAAVVTSLLAGIGCEVDSNLDPSHLGRYEHTPVVLPILDRLDVVEQPDEDMLGTSEVTSEDLIPQITEYKMGPEDLITVTVFELITPGVETVQTRRIDALGYIRLPEIGQVKAGDLSPRELEQRIIDILHPDVIRDPEVSVVVQEGRQKTFSVMGATPGVGTYTLQKTDFRLLDALALAGGLDPQVEEIFVIRQVPLSDLVEGVEFGEPTEPGVGKGNVPEDADGQRGGGGDVDRGALLDSLMGEDGDGDEAGNGGGNDNNQSANGADLGAALDDAAGNGAANGGTNGTGPDTRPERNPVTGLGSALEGEGEGRWVNIDGEWVRVQGATPEAAEDVEGAESLDELPPPDELITQRIIAVDAQKLLQGVARYNLVIRPDDVIRIPADPGGNFYMGGEIARPGTYSLPRKRSLTLKNAIAAAGGLSPIGIPERVDLIRRLEDGDSEAILRINARAIFEGLTPDFYLKPNDQIVIGTNLPASYLAVIRNGFRMSYGFGFLLDRNFGRDVFGAPPDSNNR